MIIIRRIRHGVIEHFPIRASEWVMASAMTSWGLIVLVVDRMFDQTFAWQMMAAMADENAWGAGAVAVGVLRLIALLLNGTFAGSWYSTYSPHVRAAMSMASCFLWLSISIGLLFSGSASTGMVIYPHLFFLDAVNYYRAMGDVGLSAAEKAAESDGR